MSFFSLMEWNAVLNRAIGALREQEWSLEEGRGGYRSDSEANHSESEALHSWEASRQRFHGAYSRLAQLAEQGHPADRYHLRRVVERLSESAEDLEGRRRGPKRQDEGRWERA